MREDIRIVCTLKNDYGLQLENIKGIRFGILITEKT